MPPPTRESTASSPPGPVLQAINAALHREPLSTIVYGCLWCVILTVGTALALVALQIRMLYQLLGWYHTTRQNHHHSDHGRWEWRKRLNHGRACDPALHPECAMAVVITGCDSGFGHEMALWAAAAGYTVFAGCLHVPSGWEGPIPDRIVPFAMDVTSDVQVQDAVAKVQAWLREGGDVKSDSPEGKKSTTRVLHALINNAGVGTGGLVDWAELSDFQFCMDGTHNEILHRFSRPANSKTRARQQPLTFFIFRVFTNSTFLSQQSTTWVWYAAAKPFYQSSKIKPSTARIPICEF